MTLVIDLCSRDLSRSEFVSPIVSIVGPGARLKRFIDVEVEEVRAAPSIIICGTAMADDDYLEHMDDLRWLQHTQTPVLGICAGMQLIALHNGARLVEGKEIGMVHVEPVEDNPIVPEPIEAYGLHKYDLADLDMFRVLARSPTCVQAIVHRDRPLYGVLFHPEVRRGNVVSRFLELHGNGGVDRGVDEGGNEGGARV